MAGEPDRYDREESRPVDRMHSKMVFPHPATPAPIRVIVIPEIQERIDESVGDDARCNRDAGREPECMDYQVNTCLKK